MVIINNHHSHNKIGQWVLLSSCSFFSYLYANLLHFRDLKEFIPKSTNNLKNTNKLAPVISILWVSRWILKRRRKKVTLVNKCPKWLPAVTLFKQTRSFPRKQREGKKTGHINQSHHVQFNPHFTTAIHQPGNNDFWCHLSYKSSFQNQQPATGLDLQTRGAMLSDIYRSGASYKAAFMSCFHSGLTGRDRLCKQHLQLHWWVRLVHSRLQHAVL